MWHNSFTRSILVSILQCQLNSGSPVDTEEANYMFRPQESGMKGNEQINHAIVDDLEAIVTPGEDTEQFVTDLSDNNWGVFIKIWSLMIGVLLSNCT